MSKNTNFWLKQGKEAMLAVTKMAAEGVSFERMIEKPERVVKAVVPVRFQFLASCVLAYFFFHFYLLYVLIYCGTKATCHWAINTRKDLPKLTDCKRKIYMTVASLFVAHSLSSFLSLLTSVHNLSLRSLFDWFIQLKPQINIKPQLKVITSSSHTSCSTDGESCVEIERDGEREGEPMMTKTELSVEEVGTGLAIDLLPADKQLRQLRKSMFTVSEYTKNTAEIMNAIASTSFEEWTTDEKTDSEQNSASASDYISAKEQHEDSPSNSSTEA